MYVIANNVARTKLPVVWQNGHTASGVVFVIAT